MVAGLAVVAHAAARADAGFAVEHTPVSCLPTDRYARLAARAPADAALAGAELQFRLDERSAWYAVRMISEGGEWAGYLPRPTRSLARLDYRIVMTGVDATSSATSPVTVRVADPAECATPALSSLAAPIVVAVPAGAPVVPPVPAGMSPAGVLAADGPKAPSKTGRHIAVAVAGAVVVGAAAVAAAGGSTEGAPTEPNLPGFRFNGTSPLPGSVLSPDRDALTIFMRLDRQPETALPLSWTVLFQAAGRPCLTMAGRLTAGPGTLDVALTGPLFASIGGCGARFEVDTAWITIVFEHALLYNETHALPFTFVR